MDCLTTGRLISSTATFGLNSLFKLDGSVKTIFSRKDAKIAKKIVFKINKLPLRTLWLCVSPAVAGLIFYEAVKLAIGKPRQVRPAFLAA